MSRPSNIYFLDSSLELGVNLNLYLGNNTIISDTTESYGFTTNLPMTINNTLTCQQGFHVNSDLETSSLTIDVSGNLITNGNIIANGSITSYDSIIANGLLNSSSINVNSGNFSVTNTGLTTINDDLIIGSNFRITKTTGSINTDGNIIANGSITSYDSIIASGLLNSSSINVNSGNFLVTNTGLTTINDDLLIGSNFRIIKANGSINTRGDIIASGVLQSSSIYLNLDNFSVTNTGLTTINDDLIIGSNFRITKATGLIKTDGNIIASGLLQSSSIYLNSNNFSVTNTGLTTINDDLIIGSNFRITKANGLIKTDGNIIANSFISNNSITTDGLLQSSSIYLNSNNFSVTNTGLTTINDDLIIGSNFRITKANGSINTSGDIIANSFTSNNSIITDGLLQSTSINLNSNNFSVSNTGLTTIKDDLIIGSNFRITKANGSINTSGDIIANSFISNNSIITDGLLQSTSINLSSGNFSVSSTGLTTIKDDLIIGSNFRITKATDSLYSGGSVTIGGNFSTPNLTLRSDGAVITALPYENYIPPSASSNTSTTTVNNGGVDFTSNTSQYLATQTYVDKQLWNQTVRINTILGNDSSILDSFQNVYNLVTALEGSTTANVLGGIVDKASEINTSVSDLAGNAFNTVLINCSKSVWGNECAPLPIPSTLIQTINSQSLDGWYFSNIFYIGISPETGADIPNKITWFLPSNGIMSVSDFTNIYANIFAFSTVSLPNITIYTKPKNDDTDYVSGSYNASITYSFTVATTTNNKYLCLCTGNKAPKNNFNITPISCNSTTTLNALKKTINNNNQYDTTIVSSTDEILYFCMNTSTDVSLNSVAFVLNSFNIQQNSATGVKGTTQMLFQNSSVCCNYLFNSLSQKNSDFSNISSKNSAFLRAYNNLYNT